MPKSILSKSFVVIISGFVLSCSSTETNPFGLENIGQLDEQSIEHVELNGTAAELSLELPDTQIGTSDELLIGSYKGANSAIVVKFESVSEVISSGTVQDALLIFSPAGSVSGDSTGSYEVNAHKVTVAWSTENVDPDAILSSYDAQIAGTATFAKQSLLNDTLKISAEVVQGWVDNTTANQGLLLLSQDPKDIHIYFSDETVVGPQLKVTYTTNDSTKEVTLSDSDASSVVGWEVGFELPEDRLSVATGLASSVFLKFDFPEIPANSTINHASVTLQVDTSASIFPSTSSQFRLVRMFANTADWANSPKDVDSSRVGISTYSNSIRLEMDISSSIQSMATDRIENFGFRLTPINPNQSIFRTVFFSSSVADSSLIPRAEVFYTVPRAGTD
ncbi:MAG: DNRLRE domain-containing protein [bacterium]